ncbi:glycerophosphodiester phosphodiesterase family protein [Schaalia hyovaginalis]|uniref:glycerophosphodiester phosphodiesterase family protein n=1 Tax=Schaalia hyovaginalis TaxID=29316 RepID=UPI002A803048|nr:glycerophosphodiester phosphodiesterase family protein [Schaalia hyovaginalis]MDY3664918.1 glycerophosphodiester phosphodiesterase family protein [Schaalia hyovaginalis]
MPHTSPSSKARRRPERLPLLFRGLSDDLWLYLRYIVLSKSIALLILLPAYRVALTFLLARSGRAAFTSGDARGFLLSAPGFAAILLSLLLAALLLVLDVVAYVVAAQARLEGEPVPNARALLLSALKTFPRLLHPSALLLIPYILVIAPLVRIGPRIEALDWLEVPAFITEAIAGNRLHSALYGAALITIALLAFLLIATIPAMLMKNLTPGRAMLASIRFVSADWKGLLLDALILAAPFVLGALLLSGLAAGATGLLVSFFPASSALERFSLLFLSGLFTGLPLLLLLIAVPLQLRVVVRRFARNENPEITPRTARAPRPSGGRALRSLLALSSSALILFTASCALLASGALSVEARGTSGGEKMQIVAHRAGGDLDAENSLAGLEGAIREGVAWAEIDVQRTRDGRYVINHDSTFSRVAGRSSSTQEMTLEEIRSLSIANAFTPGSPSRPVASLEEMLDAAKDRIGLFIELKGATADRRMAEDVAEMVRVRGMTDQVVLLSLSLDLIRTIETTRPELATGYLYFFSFGSPEGIPSDHLVMEEGVFSESLVESAHAVGKKVFVWTVNSEDSMRRFAASSADGVITDHPVQMSRVLAERALSSELELLVEALFLR